MPHRSLEALHREYRALPKRNLDMTRGKPSADQLALSEPMLTITETRTSNFVDCRNYGNLDGIPESRKWFGDYLGVPSSDIIVGGNSSLALMHDIFVQCLIRGPRDQKPWSTRPTQPRFICPVPGYDRHFAICERYGVEMVPIGMTDNGPDMDAVKELVGDPAVVGMWCVPKYSNPTGVVYSSKCVSTLASMETGNQDFRIFWDHAYAVHDFREGLPELADIREECVRHGTENRVFIFGSTSKVTFAGGGMSAVAMSPWNREWYLKGLQVQTIGPDKLNQLRHVRFLPSMGHVQRHMARHAELLRPKFDAVHRALSARVADKATWTRPDGGYFISLDVPGCAARVVQLASGAGVKLTPAGATFPYGHDPRNANIRIAPSFPPLEEVEAAMEIVALCIDIATEERRQNT